MMLSGSASGTTTTATDGSYSFAAIDDGANCTVTASKVLRLNGNLEDAGEEVLVSVTVHGVTSNKVRIKIDAP